MARSPVSLAGMFDAMGMPEEHSWNVGMAVANNDIDPNQAIAQWLQARFKPQELKVQQQKNLLDYYGKYATAQGDLWGKEAYSGAIENAAKYNQEAEVEKERQRMEMQRIQNQGTVGAAQLQAQGVTDAAKLRNMGNIEAARIAAGPKSSLLGAYKANLDPIGTITQRLAQIGIKDPFQALMLMSMPEDQMAQQIMKMRQAQQQQAAMQQAQPKPTGGLWGWLTGGR